MTRKCISCGETKGLKSIFDGEDYQHRSICKSCYFETCSCEEDNHMTGDCIEQLFCPNHKDSLLRFEHWNELDYNYKLKKNSKLTVEEQYKNDL